RNFELGRRRTIADVERLHGIAFTEAKSLHRTMSYAKQRREVAIVPISQRQAIARNQADEMLEGGFDGFQVFEDVGVIEFEVADDRNFRAVMDELAAFVEEGGVIFVAFDDEPFAVSEPGALAEIVRNAADEVARVKAVVFENPRQQRGRG